MMELVRTLVIASFKLFLLAQSLPLPNESSNRDQNIPLQTAFLHPEFNSEFASKRVVFSQRKPSMPPFQGLDTFSEEQENVLRNIAQHEVAPPESDGVTEHSRQKRSARFDNPMVFPACESTSEWVQKTTAEDMWGNTHTVLQEIEVGGSNISQYFYETRCRHNHTRHSRGQQCNGIDNHRYASMCMEKFIWVYAKVRDNYGQVGWTLVKTGGSCNCGLTRRPVDHTALDLG